MPCRRSRSCLVCNSLAAWLPAWLRVSEGEARLCFARSTALVVLPLPGPLSVCFLPSSNIPVAACKSDRQTDRQTALAADSLSPHPRRLFPCTHWAVLTWLYLSACEGRERSELDSIRPEDIKIEVSPPETPAENRGLKQPRHAYWDERGLWTACKLRFSTCATARSRLKRERERERGVCAPYS